MTANISPERSRLTSAKRVVVKLGSRVLATNDELIADLCDQIVMLSQSRHIDFLIVSSGAVALGWQLLGYEGRPTQIPRQQAAASAGQTALMSRYINAFGVHDRPVAQVLLTHSDLASRRRLTNAQNALSALFAAGAIPVINENDAVSAQEIAFGDNDQLASMVVPLVQADLLLLLSDIPGVLDPNGERIAVMTNASEVGKRKSSTSFGSGGIESKVNAARKASRSGAHVIIGSATESNLLSRILAGEDIGTLFTPHPQSIGARKHWIAYTLRPRGEVLINEGAAQALVQGNGSLLPVGVVGVRGQFSRGDAVKLIGPEGEVARGLSRMGLLEVARAAGRTSSELATLFGELDPVVVHRDDLVLTGE